MRILATLLQISSYLPTRNAQPAPAPKPVQPQVKQQAHKGGSWYFADSDTPSTATDQS